MDWTKFVSIREIQVLAGLTVHPNIVRLFDAIYSTKGECCLVYEYCNMGSLETHLEKLRLESAGTQDRPLLPDERIRSILSDALQGLQHIHANGFIHRDITPGNLLLSDGVCKVGDFTLARPVYDAVAADSGATPLTSYVTTRWYRAPEILLEAPRYGTPVDAFAMGCIAAEMCHRLARPLFEGDTTAHQLHCILCTLGTPDAENWPQGVHLMRRLRIQHPVMEECLDDCLPAFLSQTAVDWIRGLLALCPERRLSAAQALAHPFLSSGQPGIIAVQDDKCMGPDVASPESLQDREESRPEMAPPQILFNPYKARGR